MAKAHPVETKARAFALYLDYCSHKQISELLDLSIHTLREWIADSKVDIDGVGMGWKELRDVAEAKRGLASADREMEGVERFEWEEYAKNHRDEAAQSIQKVRQFIVDSIGQFDDKGNPLLKPSAAALKGLVETELLLQGKATKITEERQSLVMIIGQIVTKNIDKILDDDGMKEILIDAIGQDFDRMMTVGPTGEGIQKVLAY